MKTQSLPDNPVIAINVADIVEDNGKTIRENNLEKVHDIPIGTLVEVTFDKWHGDGACENIHARLWVASHDRDCDGTPLYSLSRYKEPMFVDGTLRYRGEGGWWLKKEVIMHIVNEIESGFSRESLTPVEVTQALKDGVGSLCWDEK
jgi:hypothetical protein